MNRRDAVIALAALCAASFGARGQQPRKLPVIGYLHPGFPPPATNPSMTGLRDGLRELGYVEGETIRIETRWGLGKPQSLAGFAEELVKLNVDALVAVGPPSVMAAKGATSALPILALDLETDPIASGLFTKGWGYLWQASATSLVTTRIAA